jgi:hypothetical protein
MRSNAGLYYENLREFVAALSRLSTDVAMAAALGRNGCAYYGTHYAWPVVEGNYLDMLQRLQEEPAANARPGLEPLPGWFVRRKRTAPPAADVVAALPSGPAVTP